MQDVSRSRAVIGRTANTVSSGCADKDFSMRRFASLGQPRGNRRVEPHRRRIAERLRAELLYV
jgi:hypothetical protein